jgi:alpha-L-fucosidase 2
VVEERKGGITYQQLCAGEMQYTVSVSLLPLGDSTVIGSWTVSSNSTYPLSQPTSKLLPAELSAGRYHSEFLSHAGWWGRFWNASSIQVPDSVLERQWYLEQYKFGSASRRGAPPISLQAIWTADNGQLPPWKGDFHNDLNTQLSYWPCYAANHLEEALAFPEWLWQCKPVFERYTRTFFGTEGLNVPGVATLTGEPMGGWIQYAFSPTVSAWLAQHFYQQWRYSLDTTFLRARAYPWIRGVAIHLDECSVRDERGRRRLPLSSSPEINDNRIDAWFQETTNYDLALIRWLYDAASEAARVLGRNDEADRWKAIEAEWPELALSSKERKLLVAPGIPLSESHRHFSHLMSIFPLGLLDWDRGEHDRQVITASLSDLERLGTDWWCGYSYAWLASLWTRARNGGKAATALRTFATCFCLRNSFHVNGDQSGSGKSKFTYHPFTLEGNFAFAEGLQEMLLQSYGGVVRIFPAIPDSWRDVSFRDLRAEGAVLISAARKDGSLHYLRIFSEKGGSVKLVNPFIGGQYTIAGASIGGTEWQQSVIAIDMKPGTEVVFEKKPS